MNKYSIAVLTLSRKTFNNFMKDIVEVNNSIEFLMVNDVMHVRGILSWVGWIELHDAYLIKDLYIIRYNIEIRKFFKA